MPAPDMPAGDLPVSPQDIAELGADTFSKLLLRHGLQRGQKPAIREKRRGIWRTLTWRDLAEEVAALAGALSTRGLRRGAHVAFVGDNRPRLYAAMGAAQWLGAVAVPLYQDASAEEMVAPLQCAQATHVFAENQEQVDKLLTILPRCPTIQCIVYDKDRGMRHYRQSLLVSYADLLREGREFAAARPDVLRAEVALGSGQDAAFLYFTSGTTGPAKGVVFTSSSLIDRARVTAAAEGMTASDVGMAYLPPGWIGQNIFAYVLPLVVGCCICCPESSETMVADMREIGPTYFLATPRVLEAILTQVELRLEDTGGFNRALYERGTEAARRIHARHSAGQSASFTDRLVEMMCRIIIYGPLRDVLGMSRLRVAYTAGDTITPDLLTYFRALGVNLKQFYGSTETGFFVSMAPSGDVKVDTVGLAVEGVELQFTPEREILVRSPGLFREYHGDPEATATARQSDGWFRTGDAGYLGDDGHLRIIDRVKNVGKLKHGAPFAPRLIESRLKYFTAIKEAVVFGDGRAMATALIDIDPVAAGRWADKRFISYAGHADLASRDEIYGLVADCIAKVNADLARDPLLSDSQIQRFAIVRKELRADDGVLTRAGKVRRDVVAERYKALIDGIYSGRSEVRLGPEYGSTGHEFVEIKIREVEAAASVPIGKAA
jgi:long-chain acyl-CoA synthetase